MAPLVLTANTHHQKDMSKLNLVVALIVVLLAQQDLTVPHHRPRNISYPSVVIVPTVAHQAPSVPIALTHQQRNMYELLVIKSILLTEFFS